MLVEKIELDNGSAMGMSFAMQNASLLVIRADKGFVMCSYLDMETASALGDVAVKVKGVKSFEDVLTAPVVGATQEAINLGIRVGMTGKEALELMF